MAEGGGDILEPPLIGAGESIESRRTGGARRVRTVSAAAHRFHRADGEEYFAEQDRRAMP